jgi:CYTH domain-containing protein
MSEKKVNLVNSYEVQVMKEKGRDFIDIDVNSLEEQKFYRVEYEGDVYAVEKLTNGKIVFYEVIE